MAKEFEESDRALPRERALQVADAYSRLRRWLRDCSECAPLEELSAVLARLELYRPADEWAEVTKARARYEVLRKAKAQLAVAMRRAPLDVLEEAIRCSTAEPARYHSHAQLALSNSISGLEVALSRARSSGLKASEDICAAEVRLHDLMHLYKKMEDYVKLHARSILSCNSKELASPKSTAEPAVKLNPCMSASERCSAELRSPTGAAEADLMLIRQPVEKPITFKPMEPTSRVATRPVPRAALALSISTCSADEPSIGNPEAALAGVEVSTGNIAAPVRASAALSQDAQEDVSESSGTLLPGEPHTGATSDGLGVALRHGATLGLPSPGRSLPEQLMQHALASPPAMPRSTAPVMSCSVRKTSRCRVSRRRCRRGRSSSSLDDTTPRRPWRTFAECQSSPSRWVQNPWKTKEDSCASKLQAEVHVLTQEESSASKLQAEVCALSEVHAGMEMELAEQCRTSEAVGEQAAALELLGCLEHNREERQALRTPARKAALKSGHISAIAWLLMKTNGERRSQIRHLELSEQRLSKENDHLRLHSTARQKQFSEMETRCRQLSSESAEETLEQRNRLLLEELNDARLREEALTRENGELRLESEGMQERFIVAGDLVRHAQARAENAALEVQQAAAEFVGAASPYPEEGSIGSRALPALTCSELEANDGNARDVNSLPEVVFDAREAVELCSWDTVPGEVCVHGESIDASSSFEAGSDHGESLWGSLEAPGPSASSLGRVEQPSQPIEDFMSKCRRFQSWS